MKYQDLIAVLDDLDVALENGFGKASAFIACTKATRKVIELHEPYGDMMCTICEGISWPCSTIQAIAEELNHG